ncbi:synaptic vesicle 2-related protein [Caerostris darwini]|uniref:Synaptic vesicle 2-related protein n=1 Tax=Caerostris darwini TaxID=1538125 RepID=A0AAV4W7Q0_9ARAC|nr:synaptic vesicle 2-related protein [Caerostris darwini]
MSESVLSDFSMHDENSNKETVLNGGNYGSNGYGKDSKNLVYSVDDAVNKAGYGIFQIKLTFLAGLGWLADAFEIFILSVIGDFMACDWILYRWQIAVLTSIVFAGIMVGSPVLGAVADIYGRKKCLIASMVLLFVFGVASAASPSYIWMVVLRTCMGFSLGGIAQGNSREIYREWDSDSIIYWDGIGLPGLGHSSDAEQDGVTFGASGGRQEIDARNGENVKRGTGGDVSLALDGIPLVAGPFRPAFMEIPKNSPGEVSFMHLSRRFASFSRLFLFARIDCQGKVFSFPV